MSAQVVIYAADRSSLFTLGDPAVEVAILLPVFLLQIALATVVGRLTVAATAVTIAAHDAARAASVSRDHNTAHEQAIRVARTTLAEQGCVART